MWNKMRQQSAFSIATNPEMDDRPLFSEDQERGGDTTTFVMQKTSGVYPLNHSEVS